ncbi:metalloregulator ArsR/SmtB family transcription factor [Denitrificimonas sp. JX-1]|uniref:Metalloregulator ArsR/SmtB family transcription factor n=1 Tax=Denitrificimonas halotolerans TaxID=3098930 RepID=A0ABU5GQJ1_9GAMM|nr:metalloregulator ArsR/SmtB family transcription factor [Denitrificimonas sp. JX-1]MDY7219262.1 metalloregulator ArsR/SmtB family transcription factor [Denitrificimonas sp. JX-1]
MSFTPTEVFKSLADDTRARIVLLITAEGELCVCELTESLQEAQPKISRHLAVLRTSGVLLDRRQGQWIYYRLHPELPAWVLSILKATLAANQHWLVDDLQRLQAMNRGPSNEPICN